MNEALAELGHFTADAQPPSVFIREIQDMLHNTGYSAALFSLVDLPGAAEPLAALLADGRAGLVRASYPGETADRIGLLCGVNSFHQGDLPAAREHLKEFLHGQSRLAAETTAQPGRRKLARFLADAIVVQTTETDGPAPPRSACPPTAASTASCGSHRKPRTSWPCARSKSCRGSRRSRSSTTSSPAPRAPAAFPPAGNSTEP